MTQHLISSAASTSIYCMYQNFKPYFHTPGWWTLKINASHTTTVIFVTPTARLNWLLVLVVRQKSCKSIWFICHRNEGLKGIYRKQNLKNPRHTAQLYHDIYGSSHQSLAGTRSALMRNHFSYPTVRLPTHSFCHMVQV